MKTQSLLVLSAPSAQFRDAVVLGQGLPLEKDGHPVRYYWKEVLRPGSYQDKDGKPFDITPARVGLLLSNFNKAKATGFLPRVPDGHTSDAKKNMGFVVDARVSNRGSLELLHQLVGEDAFLAAARNKSSIYTVADFEDEHGQKYDELILHNAICPDPQLNNLDDFKPALAASRGATAVATVLTLAASQESKMDVTKLREALGAKQEIPDTDLIAQAVAKLNEHKATASGLELSRTTAETKLATEKDRADKAEAKVLELSKGQPDQSLLDGNKQVAEGRLNLMLQTGQCTEDQAKIIREQFITPDGKPSLMLSRGAYAGPVDGVFKILELNKALDGFRKTDGQPVPRTAPGDDKPAIVTDERKKELLATVGL